MPTGCKAISSRKMNPRTTTSGPESQTIFRTGGRLRMADMRSCHALVIDLCGSLMSRSVPRRLGRGRTLIISEVQGKAEGYAMRDAESPGIVLRDKVRSLIKIQGLAEGERNLVDR